MSLPNYLKQKEMPCPHCGQNLNLPAKATEMLTIAVEALEHQTVSGALDVSWYKWRAEEALRRIEEIGK